MPEKYGGDTKMSQTYEADTMGRRISRLRREKGYTQEQLAELLHISPQAVSKWENDISNPDISIIPQLASVLGVSADELLGIKPIETQVVVVDTDSGRKDAKQSGHFNFQWHSGKVGTILFGILLLAVGVLFLLNEVHVISITDGVGFWSIAWPILIIGLGASMIGESIYPVAIGLILIGAYKLLYIFSVIPAAYPLTWAMIWPAALVLIGLSIVTSVLRKKKRTHHVTINGKSKKEARVVNENQDGFVTVECDFSETRHDFIDATFRGAHIETNFGTTCLDLSKCADFAADAAINAEVNFGSFELLLPATVMIDKSVENCFASCNIKGNPGQNASATIRLSGEINFGSVEVRYI